MCGKIINLYINGGNIQISIKSVSVFLQHFHRVYQEKNLDTLITNRKFSFPNCETFKPASLYDILEDSGNLKSVYGEKEDFLSILQIIAIQFDNKLKHLGVGVDMQYYPEFPKEEWIKENATKLTLNMQSQTVSYLRVTHDLVEMTARNIPYNVRLYKSENMWKIEAEKTNNFFIMAGKNIEFHDFFCA